LLYAWFILCCQESDYSSTFITEAPPQPQQTIAVDDTNHDTDYRSAALFAALNKSQSLLFVMSSTFFGQLFSYSLFDDKHIM